MPVLEARPRVRCKACQDSGFVEQHVVSDLNPANKREGSVEDPRTGLDLGLVSQFQLSTRFRVIHVACESCPPPERPRRDWER